ncbi:hypothetical protein COW06_00810 [Candidatus Gracilibacteria bacterium CG12_big_fil_rev_8_21_14_0_65_38_15]|nr:MAG: hypothetical protein COW06_00810 [Candidatus Gracilibacteria bacterium CG12_big_fil_rev_8_21_14_0_65_38_15]
MEKIKEKLRELINSADESKHSKEELDNLSKFVENLEKFTYPTNIKKGVIKNLELERQHTIPGVFLNGFTENNDGMIYLYDLSKKDFVNESKVSTNSILKEEDIYVFTDKSGKKNYFFEKFTFSFILEGGIKNVLGKFLTHEKLIERDWQILSGFIAFQFTRTKRFLETLKYNYQKSMKIMFQNRYKTFEHFEERFKKMQKETGYKTNVTIRETYDYIKAGNYDAVANKDYILTTAMSLANDFWPLFLNAHYEILETRKLGFFMCSDVPFFIIPPVGWPKNMGLGLMYPPKAERIMPLNKTQCVKITLFPKEINHGVSCSYKTINEKMTNRINTEISLKCVGTNPLLSATVSDRLGNT